MVKIDLEYPLGVLIVTSCLLTIASSCFITNCPPGGKRSISSTRTVRQCLKCGPGGLGQCFGTNICCGELIGCHIRTIESANCAKENDIPVLCEVRGKPCAGGRGRCGTEGVCCNEETCTLDDECSRPAVPVDNRNKELSQDSIDEELGILLQRLLHSPREGSAAQQGEKDR